MGRVVVKPSWFANMADCDRATIESFAKERFLGVEVIPRERLRGTFVAAVPLLDFDRLLMVESDDEEGPVPLDTGDGNSEEFP